MDSQHFVQKVFTSYASEESIISSMDTDEYGNFFVTGFVNGNGLLFNTIRFNLSEKRLFIAKISGNGNVMWSNIAQSRSIGFHIQFAKSNRMIHLFGCFEGSEFTLFNRTMFGTDTALCQAFFISINDNMNCEPCTRHTFISQDDHSEQVCMLCPFNQFTTGIGSSNCSSCNIGFNAVEKSMHIVHIDTFRFNS